MPELPAATICSSALYTYKKTPASDEGGAGQNWLAPVSRLSFEGMLDLVVQAGLLTFGSSCVPPASHRTSWIERGQGRTVSVGRSQWRDRGRFALPSLFSGFTHPAPRPIYVTVVAAIFSGRYICTAARDKVWRKKRARARGKCSGLKTDVELLHCFQLFKLCLKSCSLKRRLNRCGGGGATFPSGLRFPIISASDRRDCRAGWLSLVAGR